MDEFGSKIKKRKEKKKENFTLSLSKKKKERMKKSFRSNTLFDRLRGTIRFLFFSFFFFVFLQNNIQRLQAV